MASHAERAPAEAPATSSSMTWSTEPLDVQTSTQQRSQLGWSARMARGQTVSL